MRIPDPDPAPAADPSPVARLFAAHHAALYRYLVRLTGDPDLAADAAQEAFVRALTRGVPHMPNTPDTAPGADDAGRAWLFRVATRVALDERRTAGRRRRLLDGSPARAPLGDPPPDAQATLEARDRYAHVAAALAALPVRDRTALLLREAGFAHREIAAALETTTGAVGTVLARAVVRLAAQLRDTVPGGPGVL